MAFRADAAGEYELAFTVGRDALLEQGRILDGLRTRSGVLISAASIASSFLGAQALAQGTICVWGALALASLAGLSFFAVRVLWPTDDWEFTINASALIRDYVESDSPASIEEIHRELALHAQEAWEGNKARMAARFEYFRYASMLLLAEVGFWLLELANG